MEEKKIGIGTTIFDKIRKLTFKIIDFDENYIDVEHVPEFSNNPKKENEKWLWDEIIQKFKDKKIKLKGFNYMLQDDYRSLIIEVNSLKNEGYKKKIELLNNEKEIYIQENEGLKKYQDRIKNVVNKRKEKRINQRENVKKKLNNEIRKENLIRLIDINKEMLREITDENQLRELNQTINMQEEELNNL